MHRTKSLSAMFAETKISLPQRGRWQPLGLTDEENRRRLYVRTKHNNEQIITPSIRYVRRNPNKPPPSRALIIM